MKKKIASVCIIAVITTVLFGTFFVNRAAAPTLKATAMVFSGLSPFPKFVAGDLDIAYVMVVARGSGGTMPYTIEIFIKQEGDPWQRWAIYEQTSSYETVPTLWSTNAPTDPAKRTVYVRVRVTDSFGAVAEQSFTILISMSSPPA